MHSAASGIKYVDTNIGTSNDVKLQKTISASPGTSMQPPKQRPQSTAPDQLLRHPARDKSTRTQRPIATRPPTRATPRHRARLQRPTHPSLPHPRAPDLEPLSRPPVTFPQPIPAACAPCVEKPRKRSAPAALNGRADYGIAQRGFEAACTACVSRHGEATGEGWSRCPGVRALFGLLTMARGSGEHLRSGAASRTRRGAAGARSTSAGRCDDGGGWGMTWRIGRRC